MAPSDENNRLEDENSVDINRSTNRGRLRTIQMSTTTNKTTNEHHQQPQQHDQPLTSCTNAVVPSIPTTCTTAVTSTATATTTVSNEAAVGVTQTTTSTTTTTSITEQIKNIAVAFNYELPMVDQFLAIKPQQRQRKHNHLHDHESAGSSLLLPNTDNRKDIESNDKNVTKGKRGRRPRTNQDTDHHNPNILVDSTTAAASVTQNNIQKTQQHQNQSSVESSSSSSIVQTPTATPTKKTTLQLQQQDQQQSLRRISTREKQKREVPLSRVRVKYDMQLVPFVLRNPKFLHQYDGSFTSNTSNSSVRLKHQLCSNSNSNSNNNVRNEITVNDTHSDAVPNEGLEKVQQQQKRRSSRLINPHSNIVNEEKTALSSFDAPSTLITIQNNTIKQGMMDTGMSTINEDSTERAQSVSPFLGCNTEQDAGIIKSSSSVVWVPKKRSEWEDTIAEMTAVYIAASFRRYQVDRCKQQKQQIEQNQNDSNSDQQQQQQQPFVPPISMEYIRDRIDIDDPLYGYQIRHGFGGWLQGFIFYTTFTTWNYGFEWNSHHPLCGIPQQQQSSKSKVEGKESSAGSVDSRFVDTDNSLATELQALSRSGDPGVGGIIFSDIAEISVFGALGCGEYLIRMVLDDLYINKPQYKYVVLHAADQARPFYERFGFKRVGAVALYSNNNNTNAANIPKRGQKHRRQYEQNQPPSCDVNGTSRVVSSPPHLLQSQQRPTVATATQVMGYRHWTHTHETEHSIQTLHGEPSYMMCLKLPDRNLMTQYNNSCEEGPKPGEFLEQMLKLEVPTKPKIEPLGITSSFLSGSTAKRSHSMSMMTMSPSFDSQLSFPIDNASKSPWEMNPAGKCNNKRNGTGFTMSRRKSLAAVTTPYISDSISSLVPNNVTNTTMRSVKLLNGSLTTGSALPVPIVPRKHDRSGSTNRTLSPMNDRPTKRIKLDATYLSTGNTNSSSIPKRSSFIEKQYNSVWLAVPPTLPGTNPVVTNRPPPKPRNSNPTIQRKSRKKRTSTSVAESLLSTASNIVPIDNTTTLSVVGNESCITQSILPVIDELKAIDCEGDLPTTLLKEDTSTTTVIKKRNGRSMKTKSSDRTGLQKHNNDDSKLITQSDESICLPSSIKVTKKRSFPELIPSLTVTEKMISPPPQMSLFEVLMLIKGEQTPTSETLLDTKTLRKQKVLSYPRNRIHYYNRVVRHSSLITIETENIDGDNDESLQTQYYFVLEYDEEKGLICIVPLIVRGTLLGKRIGRPRYQCMMDDTSLFQIETVQQYTIVPSAMIMKTPVIAQEAWDIATKHDRDFVTR